MPERTFRVFGHVQGVGFRWWTRSQAERLGISGTVRNLEDGSVEIRARGTEEALAQLRARLREGPPGAEVARVSESEQGPAPGDGFRIIR